MLHALKHQPALRVEGSLEECGVLVMIHQHNTACPGAILIASHKYDSLKRLGPGAVIALICGRLHRFRVGKKSKEHTLKVLPFSLRL